MVQGPLLDLRPADLLLYRPSDLVGWIIAVKTWSRFSHCEIYVGNDMAVGSRWPKGVQCYPLRKENLGAVLRPYSPPDMERGMQWFYSSATGQGYDLLGLLCFTLAVRRGHPRKMFCSEFATRFYRHARLNVIAPHWDADRVAPGSLLMTPAFEAVWTDGGKL